MKFVNTTLIPALKMVGLFTVENTDKNKLKPVQNANCYEQNIPLIAFYYVLLYKNMVAIFVSIKMFCLPPSVLYRA